MKILLAVDGTPGAAEAITEVCARPWPIGSEIRVVTVVQPPPWMPEPFGVGAEVHSQLRAAEEKQARGIVEQAAAEIRQAHPGLTVSTGLLLGWPKEELVEEATRQGADLVVVGTHGRSTIGRFLLGSVAHAVALHAPCSVEVVRARPVA